MKKIRLRKWVKVVLSIILIVDIFFMVCDCDSNWLLFIKSLITITIALITFFILGIFGEVK